jgi:hypothetical protein
VQQNVQQQQLSLPLAAKANVPAMYPASEQFLPANSWGMCPGSRVGCICMSYVCRCICSVSHAFSVAHSFHQLFLQDGTGDFYSLESVTFFIKNIMAGGANMGQNMGAYVAAAVRARLQQIMLQDRQVRASHAAI